MGLRGTGIPENLIAYLSSLTAMAIELVRPWKYYMKSGADAFFEGNVDVTP